MATDKTLADVILAINPSATMAITEENIDTIEWTEGTLPISKEDILAKKAEMDADYDAKAYQRNRKAEYPSIEDQLDDIYHNGIDGWKTTIKATKDKYPK